jgi:hypothetical protein
LAGLVLPFWVKVARSGESTVNASVRVLNGSDVVVAAGVAVLPVSVTATLGLTVTEAAPGVADPPVMLAEVHV